MAFCITTEDIRRVCYPDATTCGTVWRHTTGLPRRRAHYGAGGTSVSAFRLADLIPALRRNARHGLRGERLRALIELDQPQDVTVPVAGGDVAYRLESCLTKEERDRLQRVKERTAKACVRAFFSKAHLIDPEVFDLLILSPDVLRHVLLNEAGLPFTDSGWSEFCAAFVIANSAPEVLRRLNQTHQQENPNV